MKSKIHVSSEKSVTKRSSEEILILPDGRILMHNLTPGLAVVLRELNPQDDSMQKRARPLKEE